MAARNFNRNEELLLRLFILMHLNSPLAWIFINSDVELTITNDEWSDFIESEKYFCQQPYQDLQRVAKSFKNKSVSFEGKCVHVWDEINYIRGQGKIIAKFSQNFIDYCVHEQH